MCQTEYEATVAQFLAKKAMTRCPTVCMVPTRGSVPESDKAELRKCVAAQETARLDRETVELPAAPGCLRSAR
jgi:hypothetical protein